MRGRPESERRGWRPSVGLSVTSVAVLAVVAACWLAPLADLAEADELARRVQAAAGRWWMPLLLVLAYTPGSFLLFPRAVITLSAVIVFGPLVAFACALAGTLIAASVGYAAGRRVPRPVVDRVVGSRLSRLSRVLRGRELVVLSAIRLGPFGPFAVQNVVAGAVGVRLSGFLLATFIGMVPGTLVTTFFGDQLRSALAGAGEINYPLMACLLVALLMGTVLARRKLSRLWSRPSCRFHRAEPTPRPTPVR